MRVERRDPRRLFVVYAHRLTGHALSAALALRTGALSVAVVAAEPESLAGLLPAPGDLLLIEAGPAAEDLVRRLAERHPGALLLVFGVAAEGEGVALIEAGAAAVVLRREGLADLLATVEALAAGRMRCAPGVLAGVAGRLAELARRRPAAGERPPLSPRERQVLALMAAGLSNKEIAGRLGITLPTAKNHVHAVLGKLAARSRREAVTRAYERGLVGVFLGLGAGEPAADERRAAARPPALAN